MRTAAFASWFVPLFITYIVIVVAATSYNVCKKNKKTKNDRHSYSRNVHEHKVTGKGMSITYSGDPRYINGREIKTTDEWDEWKVIKNLAWNISTHLLDLEREMAEGKCNNYNAAKTEWHQSYYKLRKMCIQHRLWNPLIGDHAIFEPTKAQLDAESALFQKIADACEDGIDVAYQKSRQKEKILNYIREQKTSIVRKKMVNALCGTDEILKKEYRRTCDALVKESVLVEGHDSKNQLTLRIKRQYTKKAETTQAPLQLPPSIFSRTLYEGVPKKLEYKVIHTVGEPLNVDRQNNRCEFISTADGTRYYTTLSQCTCPAFGGKEPCKHMLAFAKYLGYVKF